MKTTDLMIGDWVQNRDGSIKGRIVNIDAYQNRVEFGAHTIDANFVYPIPLSEEILEKNGFMKTDFLDYGGNRIGISLLYKNRSNGEEGFRVLIENRSTGIETRTTIKPVKYVHEIQHTLKDLEIDREIVL